MSSIVVAKIGELLAPVPTPILVPVIVSLLTVLASWIATKYLRGFNYDMATYMKIPGPSSLPLLGNALDLNVPVTEIMNVLNKFTLAHGPITRLFLAHRPYILLSGADGYETVLSSNKHITKGLDYRFLWPWLNTGLLTSAGQKWHGRRKLLTPAFHFKILDDFRMVMNDQSAIMVKKMKEMSKSGKEEDVFPTVTYCALDIICQAALGTNYNAQGMVEQSPYVKAVFKASDIIFHRVLSPWIWNDVVFGLSPNGKPMRDSIKILHETTDKVIKERKMLFKKKKDLDVIKEEDEDELLGKKKRLAFLDLLIESSDDGRVLSDADIREEVDTFMFEGHDTTAANMTFTLHLLANHPEIQKKAQQELDDIFGDDRDRGATTEDLGKMKYLECCIKESLRLFPSVPLMSRTLHEDAMIEGYQVPAGTHIILLNYILHRDGKQFPDPEKYDPDRFSPENARGRHPYAYVPFSAGPRNCIGQKFAQMEEKIVVSSVLRNFDLSASESNVPAIPELILRPKEGVNIKLTPRK